jgi:hypothetical protein
MQKIAQRRGFLNKLREKVDISGRATEKYFNPEFKEIMDRLRAMDDKIRSIASGTKFGEADAPDDPASLKALLKSSNSNANKREYMKAVSDLGRFHKKIIEIVNLISSFKHNVDAAHEKFLFNDLDDESKKHLQSFRDRWTPKAASSQTYLVKESGILDFFTESDWGKALERRRALSSWEKRYPNKIKELKNDTNAIINESSKMLGILLNTLEHMDKARSTRNPESYILHSNKILDAFKKYDDGEKGFKKYYDKNIRGFLEKQDFFAPTKTDVSGEKAQELGNQEVTPTMSMHGENPPEMTVPLAPHPLPATPPPAPLPAPGKVPVIPPSAAPPSIEEAPTDPAPTPDMPQSPAPASPKMTPEEMRRFEAQHGFGAVSHYRFYQSLEKMADESPAILSSYIAKYAKSIQASDPITAVHLFQVVKSIRA